MDGQVGAAFRRPLRQSGINALRRCRIGASVGQIPLLILLFVHQNSFGGISLPLHGACKPGRFFPVVVDSVERVTLEASGCLPVDLSADNRRIIAAVLVTGPPGPLRYGPQSLPLHLVGGDETLIGTVDPAADLSALFPNRRITPIGLNPTDPLPGPPVAWETLDAVYLDSPSLARLSDQTRSSLLAGGLKIVTGGIQKPDDRWPWVRNERWWVLSVRPVGPVDELVNVDVYSPVSAWTPGRATWVRTEIVTGAVLVSLAVVAVCLWRSRWRFAVAGILLIAATGAMIGWRKTLAPTAANGGDVVVIDGPLIQRDSWLFYRGLDSGSTLVPFQGWTHPVFSSTRAMPAANLRMVETETSTAFSMPMENDRLMAFVHREVRPDPEPALTPGRFSPMDDLAKAIYAGAGYRFVGETPTAAARWATAVVRRR